MTEKRKGRPPTGITRKRITLNLREENYDWLQQFNPKPGIGDTVDRIITEHRRQTETEEDADDV